MTTWSVWFPLINHKWFNLWCIHGFIQFSDMVSVGCTMDLEPLNRFFCQLDLISQVYLPEEINTSYIDKSAVWKELIEELAGR